MEQITGILAGLDQEGAVVALFTGILLFCVVVAGTSLVFKALGKWGVVALMLAAGAVIIIWRVR